MDRASSFDSGPGPSTSSSSSRGMIGSGSSSGNGSGNGAGASGSGRPYSTAYEPRPSSALGRPALAVHPQAQAGYHAQSQTQGQGHSRNSSMSSAASPYGQPSPSLYPGYSHAHAQGHSQPAWSSQLGGGNWASSAIPANAFYPAPFAPFGNAQSGATGAGSGAGSGTGAGANGGSIFQVGFQQSQPDFAAWAGAYQQMMMASMGAQHFQQQQQQQHFQHQHHHFQLPNPPPPAAGESDRGAASNARRRTSSGPAHGHAQAHVVPGIGHGYGQSQAQMQNVGQGHPSITHRQSFDEGRSRPAALVHSLPQYHQQPQQTQQRSTSDSRYNIGQGAQPSQQIGGYHPYKRNTSGPSRKSSKEEMRNTPSPIDGTGRNGPGLAGSLPRSKSQPSLASVASGSAMASHTSSPAAPPAQGGISLTKPADNAQSALGERAASSGSRAEPSHPVSASDNIVPADEVARARTTSGDSKFSSSFTATVTPDKAEPTPATASAARGPAASRSASTSPSAVQATSVPPPTSKASAPPRAPTPLHAGPIANATNTPQPQSRSSLALPAGTVYTPEPAEKKSGGLKGRLAKALHKDKAAREGGKMGMGGSTPPSVVSSAAPSANNTPSRPTAAVKQYQQHHASPSESSTRSGTPPITPPTHMHTLSHKTNHASTSAPKTATSGSGIYTHHTGSSRFQHQPSEMQPMRPPSAPFAMPMHHQAMGSDISLAETERTQRTATVDAEGSVNGLGVKEKAKGKRSLFRMRNMSTDNISLSSTVSSASMMIRKMGSIGKLARRNSLMGISKIFKDKAKDEDGPLPEREGDKKESKKEKKERKKREKAAAAKGELVPAEVSRLSVEPDSEDRVISGLTPAAQLARQHTLRSKAEAEARSRAAQQSHDDEGDYAEGDGYGHDEHGANTSMTGEPTWDGNTFNRPSYGYAAGHEVGASSPRSPTFGPNVVHVQPRAQAMNIQHARAVTIPAEEYDSDDSSDNETMEDATVRLERNPLAGTEGVQSQRNSYRYSQTEESRDMEFRQTWGNAMIDRNAVPKKGILKRRSEPQLNQDVTRARSNSAADAPLAQLNAGLTALSLSRDPNSLDGISSHAHQDTHTADGEENKEHLNFTFDSPADISSPTPAPFGSSPYSNPGANTSAPVLSLAYARGNNGAGIRSMTAPAQRRGIMWAPECAVYSTYDAGTYDRRSEPATCNKLTPELAQFIKQELNAFKLEMPVHPASKVHTHYFN